MVQVSPSDTATPLQPTLRNDPRKPVVQASQTPSPTTQPIQDQLAVTQNGAAETSVRLLDETPPAPAVTRRPRRQIETIIKLPVSHEDLRNESARLFQRPAYEVQRMMQFLRTYAATGPASVPKEEQNLLEALPASMHSQLPGLLAMMEAEFASRELTRLAQRRPEDVAALLKCLSQIVEQGQGLSGPAQSALVASERARLSPELRAQFDSLGFNRQAFQPLLTEVYVKTQPLQTVFQKFDLRHSMREMFSLGPQTSEAQAQAERKDKAQMMLELAAMIPDLNDMDIGQLDGIAPLMVMAKTLDPNCAQLIQQMITFGIEHSSHSNPPDFSKFHPDVDLDQGQVAILLRMFQKGPGLANFNAVLEKASSPEGRAQLNQDEKKQLEELGIALDAQGNLENRLSGLSISDGWELDTLLKLKDQILKGQQTGLQEKTVMASGMALSWVHSFMQDSGLALRLETDLKQQDERIGLLRVQANNSQTRIQNSQVQVTQAQAELQEASQTRQQVTQALAPFVSGGRLQLENAVRQGRLAQINAALAPLGLEIRQKPDGQLAYIINDFEEHDPAVVYRWLDSRLEQLQSHEDEARQNLQAATSELKSAVAEGKAIEDELTQALKNQQDNAKAFEEVLARLKQKPLADLRQLLADPAFRASQSPELLAALEKHLHDTERMLQESPVLLNQIQTHLIAGQQDLQQLHQTLTSAQSQVEAAEAQCHMPDSPDLQKLREALNSQLQNLDQSQAELSTLADQLEARLNLAPQPSQAEAAKMMAEWRQALDRTYQAVQQALARQQNEQAATRTQQQRFLDRLKENLAHHTQQLDTMDQRRHESINQALAQSLGQVRKWLPAK